MHRKKTPPRPNGVAVTALAGLVLLAACSSGPTDPRGQDAADLATETADPPLNADFALQVAADEVVAEATVEDAALMVEASADAGPWLEAATLFRRARRAWRDGDPSRARALAREGRLVLAAALVERRGAEGLDELGDLVDIALERLDRAADDYARAAELRDRVAALREESDALRARGAPVLAAERLILAIGILDRMHHRFVDARRDASAFAARAVDAAASVFVRAQGAVGSDDGIRVQHALAHAGELVRRAEQALDRGAWRRAIVLARRSIGWSLHALRLAGGT